MLRPDSSLLPFSSVCAASSQSLLVKAFPTCFRLFSFAGTSLSDGMLKSDFLSSHLSPTENTVFMHPGAKSAGIETKE